MKKGTLQKIVDALFVLLIISVVFFALIWFVHAFDIFPIPKSIENLFFSDNKNDTAINDDGKILELLPDSFQSGEHEYNFLTLTSEKASQLLSSLSKNDDSYFWEVETVSGIGKNKKTQTHRVYKKFDKVRVDTTDKITDTTTVFSDSVTVIMNNITGESRIIRGDTEFAYDNIVNIAALDYLFSDNETQVKYIGVLDKDFERYLYVEIPKLVFESQDIYLVSLEHGVVMTASTEIKGETVFSQKTITFDNNSLISDETFDLLNLTEVE